MADAYRVQPIKVYVILTGNFPCWSGAHFSGLKKGIHCYVPASRLVLMSCASMLGPSTIFTQIWLYVSIKYRTLQISPKEENLWGRGRKIEVGTIDSQGSVTLPTSLRLSLQPSWIVSALFYQVFCSAQVAQFEVSGCPESHQTRTGGGIGERGLHEGGEAQGKLLLSTFLPPLVALRSMGDVFLWVSHAIVTTHQGSLTDAELTSHAVGWM